MQAAFQKHVDNAITKTVNLPEKVSAEEVGEIYQLAWRMGCKGITVYRNGSRHGQAIDFGLATTESASCPAC